MVRADLRPDGERRHARQDAYRPQLAVHGVPRGLDAEAEGPPLRPGRAGGLQEGSVQPPRHRPPAPKRLPEGDRDAVHRQPARLGRRPVRPGQHRVDQRGDDALHPRQRHPRRPAGEARCPRYRRRRRLDLRQARTGDRCRLGVPGRPREPGPGGERRTGAGAGGGRWLGRPRPVGGGERREEPARGVPATVRRRPCHRRAPGRLDRRPEHAGVPRSPERGAAEVLGPRRGPAVQDPPQLEPERRPPPARAVPAADQPGRPRPGQGRRPLAGGRHRRHGRAAAAVPLRPAARPGAAGDGDGAVVRRRAAQRAGEEGRRGADVAALGARAGAAAPHAGRQGPAGARGEVAAAVGRRGQGQRGEPHRPTTAGSSRPG